ncbi:MAG: hypothetical protein IPQ05_00950 [Leptospiraceae bacterium]|nr:hypothetical protein [Leptospiraceae bacterium]MBL0262446.1 hypothetical protein [Leptospiraceae bacterium]
MEGFEQINGASDRVNTDKILAGHFEPSTSVCAQSEKSIWQKNNKANLLLFLSDRPCEGVGREYLERREDEEACSR